MDDKTESLTSTELNYLNGIAASPHQYSWNTMDRNKVTTNTGAVSTASTWDVPANWQSTIYTVPNNELELRKEALNFTLRITENQELEYELFAGILQDVLAFLRDGTPLAIKQTINND